MRIGIILLGISAAFLLFDTGFAQVQLQTRSIQLDKETYASGTVDVKQELSWYLVKAEKPTADQLDAYQKISAAMDAAVAIYNKESEGCRGRLRVEYNPQVAAADGNANGTIRFGKNRAYMNVRTAMHEIAHTQGVGTTERWKQLVVDGRYTGRHGLEMLRSFEGETADLNADGHSFWPYGMNYDNEWSDTNAERNARLVGAMKKDGI